MTSDYREVSYPLNVFMRVFALEGHRVRDLHYGLFQSPDDSLVDAQERSTALLLARLPAPPARLLDVGMGLGALLHRLTSLGYDAHGIGPDASQYAILRARYGNDLHATCVAFDAYDPQGGSFDVVIFQESSQYLDPALLFAKARTLTARVLVLDEFALQPLEEPGALHAWDAFLAAAADAGFTLHETLDLSAQAAPTIDYFLARIPQHHDALVRDLGVTDADLHALVASGQRYRERYRTGVYGYRLADFRRSP